MILLFAKSDICAGSWRRQSGKMAALLQQVLEAPELSKLPKAAHNKLERVLSEQQYEIDALKAQQEQFRVDSGKHLS